MIRTQIQLTDDQSRILKKLALQKGTSIAEIIRKGVNLYVRSRAQSTDEERKERALKACGKFHSGRRDLSKKHDAYLAEAYK